MTVLSVQTLQLLRKKFKDRPSADKEGFFSVSSERYKSYDFTGSSNTVVHGVQTKSIG